MKFGEYIKRKRVNSVMSLKDASTKLGISASYLCDIEKNRRVAPIEKIEDMIKLYDIKDLTYCYDLVGKSRNEIPLDVARAIMKDKRLLTTIRKII